MEVYQERCSERSQYFDDELLFLVEKELKAGHQKLFIVLHAYGSHFNYKERYPESMSVFKPDNLTDAKYENKEYLMNAYDNTIRYTDGFLASLITLLQKTNSFSAMLYTSDHGEDIFDDNRKLFTCIPSPVLLSTACAIFNLVVQNI